MFYKVQYEDCYSGEHITQYVPVEDAREFFAELDEDPGVINLSAVLVDHAPEKRKEVVEWFDTDGSYEW